MTKVNTVKFLRAIVTANGNGDQVHNHFACYGNKVNIIHFQYIK